MHFVAVSRVRTNTFFPPRCEKMKHTAHANRSDAIAALLNPARGIRDEQKRKGVTPRDHTKDNMKYIKQLQDMNKKRQTEKAGALLRPEPNPSVPRAEAVPPMRTSGSGHAA